MNFMLIGKVVYGDCSGEGCKDIKEKIEGVSAPDVREKARKILEEKYPPPYKSRKAELMIAETICIFESEAPLYELKETPTIYFNLL